jgi:hypothetical protein
MSTLREKLNKSWNNNSASNALFVNASRSIDVPESFALFFGSSTQN